MRRILTSNDDQKTKPIYGMINTSSNLPYYDPYDIHIHKWTSGILKYPQNHREPLYNTALFNNDADDIVEYCSICHELNIESRNLKSIATPAELKLIKNPGKVIITKSNNKEIRNNEIEYILSKSSNTTKINKTLPKQNNEPKIKNINELENDFNSLIFMKSENNILYNDNNEFDDYIIVLK